VSDQPEVLENYADPAAICWQCVAGGMAKFVPEQ
jgi:hypothetical protein